MIFGWIFTFRRTKVKNMDGDIHYVGADALFIGLTVKRQRVLEDKSRKRMTISYVRRSTSFSIRKLVVHFNTLLVVH